MPSGGCSDGDGDDNAEPSSSLMMAAACPLFMEGLPMDFSTNPALAALASLMTEEDEEKQDDDTEISRLDDRRELVDKMILENSGGGKVQKIKSRNVRLRQSAPYPKPPNGSGKRNSSKSTVAEASLFLKIWKL